MLNFLLIDIIFTAIRLIVAALSNSMAMYTTVAKAGISLITAFMAWICLKRVSQGENGYYNYGYGKLENLTSIMKGSALLVSFAIIIYTSIDRISHPAVLEHTGLLIAIGFSLFVSCGNVYRLLRIKKVLSEGDRSPVIWSQYNATKASTITNFGSFFAVTASLVFMGQPWGVYVDPVVSILLSGFILITAYTILSDSVGDLLDKSLDESTQLIVVGALAEFFDEYTEILGVRSRRSGGIVFIEIILEFDGDRKLSDIQDVVDRMQKGLEAKIKDSRVTIVPRSAIMEKVLCA